MPVPADRGPGRTWKQGPALAVVPAPRTERAIRIGYARTSTARQELASQLEALRQAECHKIFQEQSRPAVSSSNYLAFAEAEAGQAGADDGLPLRPKPVSSTLARISPEMVIPETVRPVDCQ